jgi:hypothetical protein
MRSIAALGAAAVLFFSALAHGQLAITSLGSPVVINFDTTVTGVSSGAFAGSGFQSTPTTGQLDSDAWAISGVSTGLAFGGNSGTPPNAFARGSSSIGVSNSAGGVYSFDTDSTAATNFSLGFKTDTSNFNPGSATLRIQNDTGGSFDQLAVSYKIYVRNDQARASIIRFADSSDNSTFNVVTALNYTTTATPDPAPAYIVVVPTFSTTLTGLSVPAGGFFYLQWNIGNAPNSLTGSWDEVGVDDISVTATSAPEPAAPAIFLLGGSLWLFNYRRRFSVG